MGHARTQMRRAIDRLRGSPEAQGYYFSYPLPPERFGELLRTGIARGR